MLTINKKFFITGQEKPYNKSEPPCDPHPPIKLSDTIDQIRFGLDYVKSDCDIFIDLKTFCSGSQIYETDTIWITVNLPNNKHIDWIIKEKEIDLEYFIDGYGFTNYLFQTIYKGPTKNKYIPDIYKINDNNHIWIYSSNSTGKKGGSKIVTDDAQIFDQIWSLSKDIINFANKIKIIKKTEPKMIYHNVMESNIHNMLDKLLILVINYDLPKQSLFSHIHKLQCMVHDTTDMFKIKKLWHKECDENQSEKPKVDEKIKEILPDNNQYNVILEN